MLFPVETPPTKFGATAITVGIREVPQEIWERCLQRHMNGDWGDLCDSDKATNDRAYVKGKTHWMYSVYKNAYKGKENANILRKLEKRGNRAQILRQLSLQ